jgi:hypothetical protein
MLALHRSSTKVLGAGREASSDKKVLKRLKAHNTGFSIPKMNLVCKCATCSGDLLRT